MLERFLFRKVELWFVLLIVWFGALATFFFGWAVFDQLAGGQSLGRLGKQLLAVVKFPQTVKQSYDHLVDPYSSIRVLPSRFDDRRGFEFSYQPGTRPDLGYVLLNRFDGDMKRPVSQLFDLNTQEFVHTWSLDVDAAWASVDVTSKAADRNWRFNNFCATVDETGAIYVHGSPTPLVKFDICSRLRWVEATHMYHHSIEFDNKGDLWTAAHLEPKTVTVGGDNLLDDAIVSISRDGKVLFQKSVIQILEDNGLGALVYGGELEAVDPIHLNDILPVSDDSDYWQAGDLFLSMRHKSMIALYRPSTGRLVWHRVGPWVHQHDVNIVDERRISVFNNFGYKKGDGQRKVYPFNELMIYDFSTDTETSPYWDAFRALDIRTPTQGQGHLVSHTEVFVEETDYGRLLQFDAAGNVQWQFVNRGSDGELYRLYWSRMVPRELGDSIRATASSSKCNE